MSEPRLVVLAVLVVGCSDGTPRIVPSQIQVDVQPPLRIEGLAPDDFLRATTDGVLELASDYRADLGATSTTVIAADASGVTVTTDLPLEIGWYPLALQANGTAWFVDDALEVVGEGDPPDAPPTPVCPDAPPRCVAFRCASTTSCYYVCEAKIETAARSECQVQAIGCLVTIGDADENACIAAATQATAAEPVWLGYAQPATANEPAGDWAWYCADGTSFVPPTWGMSEPNDGGGNEDCGAMGADGAWLDGDCNTRLRYVCELP